MRTRNTFLYCAAAASFLLFSLVGDARAEEARTTPKIDYPVEAEHVPKTNWLKEIKRREHEKRHPPLVLDDKSLFVRGEPSTRQSGLSLPVEHLVGNEGTHVPAGELLDMLERDPVTSTPGVRTARISGLGIDGAASIPETHTARMSGIDIDKTMPQLATSSTAPVAQTVTIKEFTIPKTEYAGYKAQGLSDDDIHLHLYFEKYGEAPGLKSPYYGRSFKTRKEAREAKREIGGWRKVYRHRRMIGAGEVY